MSAALLSYWHDCRCFASGSANSRCGSNGGGQPLRLSALRRPSHRSGRTPLTRSMTVG